MKKLITNYQFNKAARTITLPDFQSIAQEGLLLVTNVTRNIIIYNFASPTKGATIQNNVITLIFDTSLQDDTDKLQIWYDDAAEEPDEDDMFLPITRDGQLSVRLSDDPIYGDAGPLQQHEKESPGQPIRELLTFDSNIHTVLGSQRLLSDDGKRLKVEDSPAPDQVVMGRLGAVNQDIVINLNGQGSVVVHLEGTWAGTVSFYASVNKQRWDPISGQIIASPTANSINTTTNNTFRFPTAGLAAFKVQFTAYTSGICQAVMVGTNLSMPTLYQIVGAFGSQIQALQQKAATYELLMQDTYQPTSQAPNIGLIKDALLAADPWNSKGNYSIGDTCLYEGQIYQCILNHVAGTITPKTVANWVVDQRQNKSLITSAYASPPAASRMRVEIDLDGYQYRLMESQNLMAAIKSQNDMIAMDYQLSLMQTGIAGSQGKQYAQGASGSSYYNFEEIR